MSDYIDNQLAPGKECPECGEQITAVRSRQVVDPENIDDEICWIKSDNVETTGIKTGYAGNTILLAHGKV
jgi:hypothetical protein